MSFERGRRPEPPRPRGPEDDDASAIDVTRWPGKRTLVDRELGGRRTPPDELWPGKRAPTDVLAPEVRPSRDDDARAADARRVGRLLDALAGGGAPLPPRLLADFGRLLDADLSDVRVHTDGGAASAVAALGARALAAGVHIAFAPGAFAPETPAGRHVLAHELIHVVQQQRAGADMAAAFPEIGPPGTAVEAEAEAGARAVVAGQPFAVARHSRLPAVSLLQDTPDGGVPDGGVAVPPVPGAAAPMPTAAPPAPTAPPPAVPAPQQPATPSPAAPAQATPPAATPKPEEPVIKDVVTEPGAAPSYSNDLDARLTEELDRRADPYLKARYEASLARADSLRVASIQYSYAPNSIWHNLWQSVFPLDAFREHGRQIFSANAYRGVSDGSFWGKVQVGIEGVRGVVHLLGDVAAMVGGIGGIVAMAAPLLVKIGGPFGAKVAAIGALVATIASLIKLACDIIDLFLSAMQIAISIVRIRNSKDPAERAKLAQLIKKECNDFSQTLVQVVVSAVIIGVGAAVGAAFSRTAGQSFWSALKGQFTALLPKNWKAGIAQASTAGRWMSHPVEKSLMRGVLAISTKALPTDNLIVQIGKATALTTQASVRDGLKPVVGMVKAQLVMVPAGLAAGLVVNQGKVELNAAGGGTPAIPSKAGAGPHHQSVSTRYVEAWPALLTQISDHRDRIRDATPRLRTQYNLARSDASDDTAARVDKYVGGIVEKDGKVSVTMKQVSGEADADKDLTQKAREKTQEGAGKRTEALGKAGEVDQKMQDAKQRIDEAQHIPTQPTQDVGVVDTVANWAKENVIAPAGKLLGSAQKWINDGLLKWTLGLAKLNKDELDLAGIDHQYATDYNAAVDAKADAAAAAASHDGVQDKANKLKVGLSDAEQGALQGMVDSLRWLQALIEIDNEMAEAEKAGTGYVAATAPTVQHELTLQDAKARADELAKNGRGEDAAKEQLEQLSEAQIDLQYIEPILTAASDFEKEVGTREGAMRDRTEAQTNQAFDHMVSQVPGGDFSSGRAAALGTIKDHADKLAQAVRQVTPAIDAARGRAGALLRTTEYDEARKVAYDLQGAINMYWQYEAALIANLSSGVGSIVGAYVTALEEAIQKATDGAPPAPGPAVPDAPKPPEPPTP